MSLPVDPLLDHIVALLQESIATRSHDGRGALARAVRVLPLLCREMRNLSRTNPAVPYLLGYCDYLFETGPRIRYCDGFPQSINPKRAPPASWITTRCEIIEIEDMLQGRGESAAHLDAQLHPVALPEHTLPTGLPPQVVSFTLQLRHEHARLALNSTYGRYFTTCQRKGCNRPAWIQVENAVKGVAVLSNEETYWHTCSTGSATGKNVHLPSSMSFCSGPCFCATQNEYAAKFDLLPSLSSDAPVPIRGASGTSPSRLYRAALARNASLCRKLRVKLNAATRHYPLSAEGARELQQKVVDVLNVDLGVLYAATVVFELPLRRRPNTALPLSTDWRKRPWLFTNAIRKVRSIYKAGKTSDGVAKGGEAWLGKVKTACLHVFSCPGSSPVK